MSDTWTNDRKTIADMVDALYHAWPFDMDPVVRARVLLAAADQALDSDVKQYGTLRRAAVLAIQHDIAECVSRLNELPPDEPVEYGDE